MAFMSGRGVNNVCADARDWERLVATTTTTAMTILAMILPSDDDDDDDDDNDDDKGSESSPEGIYRLEYISFDCRESLSSTLDRFHPLNGIDDHGNRLGAAATIAVETTRSLAIDIARHRYRSI